MSYVYVQFYNPPRLHGRSTPKGTESEEYGPFRWVDIQNGTIIVGDPDCPSYAPPYYTLAGGKKTWFAPDGKEYLKIRIYNKE